MSNDKTSHILFLKEQVLRFASAINHTHTTDDITDMTDEYAPKEHSDANTTYGKGTSSKYGHVKINDSINIGENDTSESDSSAMPVSALGVKTYVTNQINALKTTLKNELQAKVDIKTEVNSSSEDTTNNVYNIPTTKAVWNAISTYRDSLMGVDLARPQSINKDINKIVDPGYYKQTGHRSFSYGGETVYYTNALIKVEKQANRVIQHVYGTFKVTVDNQTTYKVNGTEYTRWGATSVYTDTPTWNAWAIVHKPYTKTIRACNFGPGVDTNEDNIRVYENTAGFIIHWDQKNNLNDRYPISADLYEYQRVCDFNPPLPITGPYVFGNLIGRFDIKIDSDKMQIRSNVNKGGRIIQMHETWFVPRDT